MKILGIGSALILILLFAVLLASCGGGGSQYYQVPSGGVEIDIDGHKKTTKPKSGSGFSLNKSGGSTRRR